MENALEQAFYQQQNQFCNLRIGDMDCTSMDFYLLPSINAFEKNCPEVELTIERNPPNVVIERMISGKYDAAFVINLAVPDLLEAGLVCDSLFELMPCVVMADGHPLFGQEKITLEDIRRQPLVAMRGGTYNVYWDFARNVCQEAGIFCENIKFVDNVFTLAMELKRGKRIAVMDRCFAPMNQDEVRYLPLVDCRTKSGIALMYSPSNTNPYLTRFRSVCKETTEKLIRLAYH